MTEKDRLYLDELEQMHSAYETDSSVTAAQASKSVSNDT